MKRPPPRAFQFSRGAGGGIAQGLGFTLKPERFWRCTERYYFLKTPLIAPLPLSPSPFSAHTHTLKQPKPEKVGRGWGREMEEGRFIEAKLSDAVPELLLSWRSEGWACNQVCRSSSPRVSSCFPPLGSSCFPFLYSTAHNATVNFKKFLVYDMKADSSSSF